MLKWTCGLGFWFFWLMACCSVRAGDDVALVGLSDRWRFMGVGTLAGLPSDWQSEAFDDSAWWEGPGGFGTTTYGESTRFPNTNGWEQVLLRRSFVIPDGADVRWLSLRVDYSGGFVLSLNGKEWVRRGLPGEPGTPVPLSAIPNPRASGSPELIPVGPAAGWIRPGTNWLTLQLHADGVYSRWPVFTAELLANFSRAPYLQNVSSNRAEVRFRTPWPRTARVEFGIDSLKEQGVDSLEGTNHVVQLEGLRPGTRYQYRVILGKDGDGGATAPISFQTLPAAGSLTVQVLGDSGWGDMAPHAVVAQMMRSEADLVLHAGDMVYPGLSSTLADIRCLSIFRPWMRTRPSAFTWGNHDLYYGFDPLLEIFGSPTNDTPAWEHAAERTLPQAYYSFDAGDVHFAVLFQPYFGQYQMRTNSPQARWLDQDLAASKKPWKVVLAHIPWETSSVHRIDDTNYNGRPDGAEFAEVLLPIAQRHGVQLYLSGHDHNYERLIPVGGMTSIVTGGGGAWLYGLREVSAFQSAFRVVYHFTQLRFEGDTLTIRCINSQGQVEDQSVIRRQPDPAPAPAAVWGTPDAVVSQQAPVWEAHGMSRVPALSSVTGRSSNLGSLRMMLDSTNLYLSLEGLALSQGSDVYLFLEVPGLPGVSSLAGLGNGRQDPADDPAAEGADGLDLAEGVSFGDGFRPSVGILVSDVLATQQDRRFRRSRSGVALGQGVFRLDASLSSVPGSRIRAWNAESLRGVVAPVVSSADTLQIAIPRRELGWLGRGQTVRVAAAVGLDLGAGAVARKFDAGFLGPKGSMVPSENPVLLGVPISMPEAPPVKLEANRELEQKIRIRWNAQAGQRYQLEAAGDLSTPFELVLEVEAVPQDGTSEVSVVTGPDQLFFRIR
jgi:3',5'-cyclic AMP phosphodiesterase CpdA